MAKAPEKKEEPAAAEVAPVAGSKKKKMIMIAIILIVVLAAGGGAAAFFLMKKAPNAKEPPKKEKAAPAVFLPMDNFTVNLQTDAGDKYLQAGITLQVHNEEQVNYYKANMPQLRSRILLLLASKTPEELLTNEGKLHLTEDIIQQAQLPFNGDEPTPKEQEERRILGVYFTSFMIQ